MNRRWKRILAGLALAAPLALPASALAQSTGSDTSSDTMKDRDTANPPDTTNRDAINPPDTRTQPGTNKPEVKPDVKPDVNTPDTTDVPRTSPEQDRNRGMDNRLLTPDFDRKPDQAKPNEGVND